MYGEAVFFRLYDVGRNIDLKKSQLILSGDRSKAIFISKYTPAYLSLPIPLVFEVLRSSDLNSNQIKGLVLYAKLYEEGVISIVGRLEFDEIPLKEFHLIRNIELLTPNGVFTIDKLLEFHYFEISRKISEFIIKGVYELFPQEFETYSAYCILDNLGDPQEFLLNHGDYLAPFLLGENPSLKLHKSQIDDVLSHPFSFLENDLVVFDWDRCLILDPNRDYEDILFISEMVNYQLLELRVLDRLLDNQLERAEEDIRTAFRKNRYHLRSLTKILGELLKLRYDMIFILENLENVTKIIGDYYLARMYIHLCDLFQLDKWGSSVRSRLETISQIYDTAKTDVNERILLYLEIGLALVFITEFITSIIPFFQT